MTSETTRLDDNVDISMRDHGGKVYMEWHKPVTRIVFDPQNAFNLAEHLARAAHKARFPGEKMPNDFSYLAQQIKQRLTDDMRDRLALRVRSMLPSLLAKDMNYASLQIVDTIFSALDAESYTRLDPRGGSVLG